MNKKPNIVLLVAEELGQYFLQYSGNPDSETPCLNRLSSESARFDRHYTVHGKCVPSRAALFSGRYPHNGGHRTLGLPLRKDEISLAALLKNKGYHNILAVKNHTVDDSIQKDQFDEYWIEGLNGKAPVLWDSYQTSTTSHKRTSGNKYADNYLFGRLNLPEDSLADYLAAERAGAFIRSRRPDDAPFFMDINFHFTHPPYEIMEPYYSQFMSKNLKLFPDRPTVGQPQFMNRMREIYGSDRLRPNDRKEMLACYYGMLAYLDRCVGMIYDALQESGQLDNTLLIFTADHGDLVGHYGIPEKWDTIFSDLIMNIPLLIRLPGGKSLHTDALTENIDLLPTILDVIGCDIPYGVQGRSLLPLLSGNTKRHRDYVFAEGGHEEELLHIKIKPDEVRTLITGYLCKAAVRELCPDSLRKSKMIRDERYKLVYRIKDNHELYDLKKDPLELHNCYYNPAYARQVMQMEKLLLNHLIESEDNLPFDPEPIS